jgi:hypothetical protein
MDPAAERRDLLGEPAGLDRGGCEFLAGGLVPCPAARALAARPVMDERDALPVRLGDDLVPEDDSLRGVADLLDVASAEPAREDAEDVRPLGLGQFRQLRLPGRIENDCPHRGVS